MTEIDVPPAVLDPGLEQLGGMITATGLRDVLRVNAGVSGLTGSAAAVAAGPIADLLGVASAPVRVIGIGLVLFAVGVGWVAGIRHRRLPAEARLIGAADVLWVAATVVAIAAGTLSTVGVGVAIAVGLVVGTFAVLELRGASAVVAQPGPPPDTSPPFEALSMAGPVDAPVEVAWRVVTDHDLYGALAPNLGRVEVTSENGPGLARRCYDNRGRGWVETCTLWDDGRRFAVAVDTSDYPYPLSVMQGSWWVEPLGPSRSQVGMTFLFQPRPGLRGRLFVLVMHAAFPFVLRRIIRGWRKAAMSAGAIG